MHVLWHQYNVVHALCVQLVHRNLVIQGSKHANKYNKSGVIYSVIITTQQLTKCILAVMCKFYSLSQTDTEKNKYKDSDTDRKQSIG